MERPACRTRAVLLRCPSDSRIHSNSSLRGAADTQDTGLEALSGRRHARARHGAERDEAVHGLRRRRAARAPVLAREALPRDAPVSRARLLDSFARMAVAVAILDGVGQSLAAAYGLDPPAAARPAVARTAGVVSGPS